MSSLNRRSFLHQAGFGTAAFALGSQQSQAKSDQPNVLFIAVDDLNDWVSCLGGHPDIQTPNIDRLAKRGVLFTNAHCSAPLCNPSRASVMTGLFPTHSGVHGNMQDWREAPLIQNHDTLPQYFRKNGYKTMGGGKIYHSNHGGSTGRLHGGHGGRQGFNHPASWDERFPSHDIQIPMPSVMPGQNYNGLDIWHWDWGGIDRSDSQTTDGRTTDWAIRKLNEDHGMPFFLGVGIYRPHGPWYVPKEYFDQYPQAQVSLPTVKDDDVNDLPAIAIKYLNNPNNHHNQIIRNDLYKSAVQAYLANITFADVMVGKVLDALDSSQYADNTIICLWSDHGWHLGEKQRWHKSTLWEEATRVPLIISAPGVSAPNSICNEAVSLIDLYPTITELCGLPDQKIVDGVSLVSSLKDPSTERSRPAITANQGWNESEPHHSVRTNDWRYILYSDGSEELYNHRMDPNEWENVASYPTYESIKQRLREWIPKAGEPLRKK